MKAKPTVALFPEASFGAALNCVGIAQELERQGANPVFICHPGFTGVFAEYGFREYHLPEQGRDRDDTNEDYWQGFINTHLPHFNLSPLEQLPTYVAPTWSAIVSTAESVEEGLRTLLDRIKPDIILLDNVIMFPAVANAGCPWVRVVSCTETEIPDSNIPPYLSGLKQEDEKGCASYQIAYLKQTRVPHRRYNEFRREHGLPQLPAGIFLENSPWLNLLLTPTAVRYQRAHPLSEDQFVFLEGCVREEGHFKMPHFPKDDGPLIYMSFGSLGAIDTSLIGRLIDVFATIPARFLVNVGGFLEAYNQVPDNVILGSWFPQPSVVAECSVFIHHGGNNSFCEALFHGVPSLIMSYCWDGHDNAQRAEATGVGRALNRADWKPEELQDIILNLINNTKMKVRLAGISSSMKQYPGPLKAAEAVLNIIGHQFDA